MDEKSYLIRKIKAFKGMKNSAVLLDAILVGLAVSGVPAAMLEFFSIFFPFYPVHFATAGCFLMGVAAGLVFAIIRRIDMKSAARYMDSFGLGERVLTAYENLHRPEEIYALQRTDTISHVKEQEENLKVRICPPGRHFTAFALSVCMVLLFALIPSQAKDTARERHEVTLEAKEQEKELEKELSNLKKADTSSLTREQKQALKELQESLKLSMEALKTVKSKEALAEEKQKLTYKYDAAEELLAENTKASAQDFAGIGSENGENTGNQDKGSGDTSGDESNASGNSGNGNSTQDAGAGSGNNSNGAGSSQSENSSENNDSSQSGSSNGEGSGNGTGGNGNGSGSGVGNGNGSGSGSGRGTGSSDTGHDYVSIPNKVGNDSSIAGSKGDSKDSDYYRAKNGLAWEGEHVSVDSVIGDYTKDAYESIASGRYPKGMESVIRDYFQSLN
ncbi:MAG: hypothetical protein PUF81_00215 [Lachnospiraceae bacterium]|nr:hypothetical protein [Lachnospiraceae bacterium]